MSWWVIEDVALREALQRAHNGEDPGLVEAELYANSAVEWHGETGEGE